MSLNLFVLEEESLKQKAAESREREDSREVKMRGGFFERPLVNLIELLLYDTDDILTLGRIICMVYYKWSFG